MAADKWDSLPGTNASRRLARILSDVAALPDDDILTIQKKFPNEYLGDVLVREKVLVKEYLLGVVVRALHIPWVDVEGCVVPAHVAELLPEKFCREHRVMPISWVREILALACVNPLDDETIKEVQYATGLSVRLVLCSDEQLDALIRKTFATPDAAEEGAAPEGEETLADGEQADADRGDPPQPADDTSSAAEELVRQLSEQAQTDSEPEQEEPATSDQGAVSSEQKAVSSEQ